VITNLRKKKKKNFQKYTFSSDDFARGKKNTIITGYALNTCEVDESCAITGTLVLFNCRNIF